MELTPKIKEKSHSVKGCKMFKVLIDGCEPSRGTKHSACIDLYASEDVTIGAGETKLIGLGVAIDHKLLYNAVTGADYDEDVDTFNGVVKKCMNTEYFKKRHYLQLMLRSSLSKELIIANGVGVVDLDYKDEIKIRVHNPVNNNTLLEIYRNYAHSNHKSRKIKKGDRIAQITLLEHKAYLFGVESDVERDGGFGSTGSK